MSHLPQILTVTLNPAIDQTLEIANFAVGKVNRVLNSRQDAGGKGINVATLLGDLHVPVCVTGFLGSHNISIFEDHFQAHHLRDHFLRIAGETRTGWKIADTITHETTDINFKGLKVQPDEAELLLRTAEELSAVSAWTVLSGSLPAGLDATYYRTLIRSIHERGGRVILDTSGPALRHALMAQPEIVKPNQAELEELLDRPVRSIEEARTAASLLLVGRTRMVVVSMGAEGALFVTREAVVHALPPRVEVKSTVGAGDAMVAGIVWAQLHRFDLEETASWATAFGAHAVTRLGAGIDLDEAQRLSKQVTVLNLSASTEESAPVAQGV